MAHIPSQVHDFGVTQAGETVHSIDISNDTLSARVLTYGAALQDLRLTGISHPLILGWPRLEDYQASAACLGVIVGRFANRIANGTYVLDGQTYQADRNFLNRHTLHGGSNGMHRLVWDIVSTSPDAVSLRLALPDGHMGFGGDLTTTVTYRIEPDATLSIKVEAQTTTASLCNIAPHIYFNLDASVRINDHELTVDADRYLLVDDDLIPTGEIVDVTNTPLDLRTNRAIGTFAFDHNYCLSDHRMPCRPVATLTSPKSGISMQLETTEPGLQVYSGAHLGEKLTGLSGEPYGPNAGIALEPQNWPDAPNHPTFPNTVLRAGEAYRHMSRFVFGKT